MSSKSPLILKETLDKENSHILKKTRLRRKSSEMFWAYLFSYAKNCLDEEFLIHHELTYKNIRFLFLDGKVIHVSKKIYICEIQSTLTSFISSTKVMFPEIRDINSIVIYHHVLNKNKILKHSKKLEIKKAMTSAFT